MKHPLIIYAGNKQCVFAVFLLKFVHTFQRGAGGDEVIEHDNIGLIPAER